MWLRGVISYQNKTNIQKLWEKLKKEKQGKLPSVTRLWATVPLMLRPNTWGKQEACSSPVIYSWPFFALKPSQGISGPLCCSNLGHTFRSSFCSYQPELFIKALLTKALKTKKALCWAAKARNNNTLRKNELRRFHRRREGELSRNEVSWGHRRVPRSFCLSSLSICSPAFCSSNL